MKRPLALLMSVFAPALAAAQPAPSPSPAAPSTRELERINWMENPRFDAAQAKTYFTRVTDKVAGLVQDTIRKWDAAGL